MYFLTSRDTLSRSTLLLDSLICRREQNAFRWISRGFRSFKNFLWIPHRLLKLILNFNLIFRRVYKGNIFLHFANKGSWFKGALRIFFNFGCSPSVRSGWVDIGQVRESIGKASGKHRKSIGKCRARRIPRAANNSTGFGLSCPLGIIFTGRVERNPNSLTKTEYTGFWGVP